MIRISNIYLPPDYNNDDIVKRAVKELNCHRESIKEINLFKLSIDARKKNDVHFLATIDVQVKNENQILNKAKSKRITAVKKYTYEQPVCRNNNFKTVVVGAGPAGLFAALILARSGMNVTLIERGKDVEKRTHDVNDFWNGGKLNTNSNVQFGEGGAGAFSDGKLTTGTKDKRIRKVFEEFALHGAPEDILYNAKPHIGTDKLKPTIKAIREEIISLGAEVLFETQLTDINISENRVKSIVVKTNNSTKEIYCHNIVLAIGHSARDTFTMLKNKGLALEAKPFAVGARIEHLREDIDKSQYGRFYRYEKLGAAVYKLNTHLSNGRGVYTFCMCPGGVVVPAQSQENTVVTNGMSYYARDKVNSNSALLVGIKPEDFGSSDPLAGMYFQQEIESRAFAVGGSDYSAPIQRVEDFLKDRKTSALGKVTPSYKRGIKKSDINKIFPKFITDSMKQGIVDMEKRLKGFADNDAILTGVESRSSSPIRILRNTTMEALGINGLYPCGEGAGYAGGIVSAAVDGIKCAEKIIEKVNR